MGAKRLAGGIVAIFFFGSWASYSQEIDSPEYLKGLELAQKHILEKRERTQTSALRATLSESFAALRLSDQFYKEGQSWEVEFWGVSTDAMARKESLSASSGRFRGKPVKFAFKVISVTLDNITRIEVRPNSPAIEPRVDHIVLKIDSSRTILQKDVYYRDGRSPVGYSGGREANLSLGFDGYPITLPDLKTIEGNPLKEPPQDIPSEARLMLSNALDFQFTDAYAREVRVIWQNGAPWPAYVKTPSGVSILKGASP